MRVKKIVIGLAILIFGLLVGVWAIRNRLLFTPSASLDKVDFLLTTGASTLNIGQKAMVDVYITPHNLHVSALELYISFSPNIRINSLTPTSTLSTVLRTAALGTSPASIVLGAACTASGCQTVSSPTRIAQFEIEAVQSGQASIAVTTQTQVAVTEDQTSTNALGDVNSLNFTINAPVTPVNTPTNTPTHTPTSSPTQTPVVSPTGPATGTLQIQARLQGVNTAESNVPFRVVVRNAGNEIYNQVITASSNNTGLFTINTGSINQGTFDLYLKGPAHLNKRFSGVTVQPGNNSLDLSADILKAGDVNGDNFVNIMDYSILAGAFEPGVAKVSLADLNQNGIVDIIDYSLLASNFNITTPGD